MRAGCRRLPDGWINAIKDAPMDKFMLKDQAAQFGRVFTLLLNRSLMYNSAHPVIKQSVADVLKVAQRILGHTSPLVFILNRDRFFVDEEALDPRINVNRLVTLFNGCGLQSISFEEGLLESELLMFAELISSLTKASDVESLKHSLSQKGIYNIKINHVVYRKVTEDDQVVSRDALKKVTPLLDSDNQEHRKRFMETLLESVLTEEFAKTLNITNLINNPGAFSQQLIQNDLQAADRLRSQTAPAAAGYGVTPSFDGLLDDDPTDTFAGVGGGHAGRQGSDSGRTGESASIEDDSDGDGTGASGGPGGLGGSGGTGQASKAGGEAPGNASGGAHGSDLTAAGGSRGGAPHADKNAIPTQGNGPLLLHQLELMQQEVHKHLQGRGDTSIADLAQAIFDMKRQLLEGIQSQKALGIAYANEAAIVDSANLLADQVLMELIKDEYQAGKVTTARLAQIIRRMIPEAADLRRLLPQIKWTLLAEGMPMAEYLNLINELRNELQSDELARILEESGATIGLDGQALIEEVKRNPGQAAELIYLASEIRKGGGDDSLLPDILVDYVEHIGNQMAKDAAENGSADDPGHLKKVMSDIESSILKKLGQMNVGPDVLSRMESRINERMEAILDGMRVQWLESQAGPAPSEKVRQLTVLQTLEHNVGEDEELAEILKTVRDQVAAGKIEENNFSRIHEEITRQKQLILDQRSGTKMAEGILSIDDVMFIMEKEIARSKRYGSQFSVISIAFVTATPKIKSLDKVLTNEIVLHAAMEKVTTITRDVDYIGRIDKNKIVVLLPTIDLYDARKALERVLRLLHAQPLDVSGVPVQLRAAGVAAAYDEDQAPNAKLFAKQIARQMEDMLARLRNIQVLF
jgi:GGDEF domain-containing protein